MKINQERLINSFIRLVQIDSESGEEEVIVECLQNELNNLNFTCVVDKTGNLIASNGDSPIIALAAHVDTVQPGKNIKPIITKDGTIKTDGSTILGADDKTGVASILEILKVLSENNKPIQLEVIFTVQEETGLVGSKNLDFKTLKSKKAINLDAEPGHIIIGEPANMQFDIEILGKSAHAMHPEKGINAIEIAANSIKKIKWGRIDEETTLNVGLINGGLARNIVPAKVLIEAEVRSRSLAKFKLHCQRLVKTFEEVAKSMGGEVKIKNHQEAWPFVLSAEDQLVQTIAAACKKNKIKPDIKLVGGNTDANVFNANGIKTITTGSCGIDYHTTQESVTEETLAKGTQIVLDALLSLSKEIK